MLNLRKLCVFESVEESIEFNKMVCECKSKMQPQCILKGRRGIVHCH